MTGNDHFEQAEIALAAADEETNWQVKDVYAGIAQAHATLAQAAAAAVSAGLGGYGQPA